MRHTSVLQHLDSVQRNIRHMKRVSILLLPVVVSFTVGCALPSRYCVTLQNETTVGLDGVRVIWDEYTVTAGIVTPGTGKTEAFPDARFPQTATVEWRTPEGQLRSLIVDVSSSVGRLSRWANVELVFIIRDFDVVEVIIEKGLA